VAAILSALKLDHDEIGVSIQPQQINSPLTVAR